MKILENWFTYSPMQYDIVSHILVLGFGVMVAAFVYFLATAKQVAPKYRLSSIMSALVMTSAALILYNQYSVWAQAFDWNDTLGRYVQNDKTTFNNGFRYANWSIDVPLLLTQVLIVVGITGKKMLRTWAIFTVCGLAMIWTGYIGQLYQTAGEVGTGNIIGGILGTGTAVAADGVPGPSSAYWIWGVVSTVFYVIINCVVGFTVMPASRQMAPRAGKMIRAIFWLFLISWTLYPVAYLVPVIWPDQWGIVFRQGAFTLADIVSKVVYGVMLTYAAMWQSESEGYIYPPASENVIPVQST